MITITTQTGQLISDEDLARIELERQINEAKQYLSSTDWLFARLAETGEAVPSDVLAKRGEARDFLREQGF